MVTSCAATWCASHERHAAVPELEQELYVILIPPYCFDPSFAYYINVCLRNCNCMRPACVPLCNPLSDCMVCGLHMHGPCFSRSRWASAMLVVPELEQELAV
jgi:hypothetical protein